MANSTWRKSSYCEHGYCLEMAAPAWRKSSKCESGFCLEVAIADDTILIRDSADLEGPHLEFSRTAAQAFIANVKSGTYGN